MTIFITRCDVIFITESQVEEEAHVQMLQDDIGEKWNIVHNIDADKYKSIAMCRKENSGTAIINTYHIPATTLICLRKDGIPHLIYILLLYRKSSTKNDDFSYVIRHMKENPMLKEII